MLGCLPSQKNSEVFSVWDPLATKHVTILVIIIGKGDNPTDMNNSLRDSLLDAWGELRGFKKPQVLAGATKGQT